MKKISILIVTILLVLLLASNFSFAVTAADNGKLKVYTTTGGYEGSWLNGFDIQGYVEGLERPISSTFSNDGYHVFLNVNGKNGAMEGDLTGNDINTQLQNMHYKEVGGTQVIDGISLNVSTSFVNNGEHIKITYTLKNTTSANAKISLATTADVQIDGDDSATITRLDNGNGVLLYTLDGDYSQKPVQFAFYGKGVSGTTAIDSLWIGGWYNGYFKHMFNNNPTVTKVENDDSAFTFAWLNRDIAAGATQTYSVLMEVGEMNMPTIELTTPNNATLYADEAIIKGIVKDSDLIDTATIHYILDNGTEQTLAPINMDGTAKNFSIDLTSLNLAVGSTHTIKVWATDNLDTKSNEETITFTIKEMRPPVINLITEEWLGEEGKFKLTDTKNASAKVAKYEYKIDDGTWTTATLDTEYVALTQTGTKTISARTVGVSGEVSDIVTKVIKLDKTNPGITFEANNDGALKLIGTDADSGIDKIEYLWSDSGVDAGTNPEWKIYSNPIKYDGNLTGTIYLWTRITDKAGNVTTLTKPINAVKAPTIVAENEFSQKYAKFKLEDNINNVNDVLLYQYKINNGEWKNCNKDTEITLDGLKGEIKITARTIDYAGRVSEEVTKTVKVTFTEGKGEKDESPRTGVISYIEIAIFITTISLLGLVYFKRKIM